MNLHRTLTTYLTQRFNRRHDDIDPRRSSNAPATGSRAQSQPGRSIFGIAACIAIASLAPAALSATAPPSINLDVDFLDPVTGSELPVVVPGMEVTVSVKADSSHGVALFGVQATSDKNFTFEQTDDPFPDVTSSPDGNGFNNQPSDGGGTIPIDGPYNSLNAVARALTEGFTWALPDTGLRLNEAIPETIQDDDSAQQDFKGTIDMTADGDGKIGKGRTEILNFNIFVDDNAAIGSNLVLELLAKDSIFDTNAEIPPRPDYIPENTWVYLIDGLTEDPNPAIEMLPPEPDNPFSFVYAEVVPLDATENPGAITLHAYDDMTTTGNSILVSEVIPEPASAALLGLGGLALLSRRRART